MLRAIGWNAAAAASLADNSLPLRVLRLEMLPHGAGTREWWLAVFFCQRSLLATCKTLGDVPPMDVQDQPVKYRT